MSAPRELNLTDAATFVIASRALGGMAEDTAALIWSALTGLPREDALAYAHDLLALGRDTVAAVPPF